MTGRLVDCTSVDDLDVLPANPDRVTLTKIDGKWGWDSAFGGAYPNFPTADSALYHFLLMRSYGHYEGK